MKTWVYIECLGDSQEDPEEGYSPRSWGLGWCREMCLTSTLCGRHFPLARSGGRRSGYKLSPFIATGNRERNKAQFAVLFICVQAAQPQCQQWLLQGLRGRWKTGVHLLTIYNSHSRKEYINSVSEEEDCGQDSESYRSSWMSTNLQVWHQWVFKEIAW